MWEKQEASEYCSIAQMRVCNAAVLENNVFEFVITDHLMQKFMRLFLAHIDKQY